MSGEVATEETPAKVESNGKQTEPKDVTELEENIIRQIEYYFGDMNLPRDKFLKEQIQLDEGWVPFTTMLKFKRLSNLSTDVDVIIAALTKSENQLVEISEDKTKIRRSPELPLPELNEERRKELQTRTIYAKGFPLENTTVDTCLDFFKKYNNPENVILRRYQDRIKKKWLFKGSVFVTFKTKEHAESFMKEESVKFGETELIREWQAKYLEDKKALYAETQSKSAKKQKQKQEDKRPAFTLPTGTVLVLSEVPETITRDHIKETITSLGGEVAFVKMEDGKAWIRLQKEDTAKGVFEKCTDGKVKVEQSELTCVVLEGEEEKQFLDEMASELVKRRQKQSHNKGNHKQHYNRKRKSGGGGDGPAAKRR